MYIVGKELGDKVIESFGRYDNIEEAKIAGNMLSEFLGEDVKIFEEREEIYGNIR